MPKLRKSREEHLYKRGKVWWIDFFSGTIRTRKSLETTNKREALKKSAAYRLRGGGSKRENTPIEAVIFQYTSTEENSYNFTPSSASSAHYSITHVAKMLDVYLAGNLKHDSSQTIYEQLRNANSSRGIKYSEASVRTYAMRWHSFLNWCYKKEYLHASPTPVEYSKQHPIPRRNTIIELDTARQLIALATPRFDLQFCLYCIFFAGMRRNEVVMARPGWFVGREIRIPSNETSICRGKTYVWRTKNRLARSIPIHDDFHRFLNNYLSSSHVGVFCLHDEAKGNIYRWDFRRPFEEILDVHRLQYPGVLPPSGVSIHTARHSWISALCNSPARFSSAQISLWSGDSIRVIESNYLHPIIAGTELDTL